MFPSIHGVVSQGGASRPPEPGEPQYCVASMPASPSNVATNAQLGPVFTFSEAVTAIGARLRMSSAGAETVRLWRVGPPATLLATVEITTVANAWVEGYFDAPIALAASTQYAVLTRRTNAFSRSTVHHGTSGFTFHPLVTFVQSRTGVTDSFPSGVDNLRVLGLADLIFTVAT